MRDLETLLEWGPTFTEMKECQAREKEAETRGLVTLRMVTRSRELPRGLRERLQ